jgi:hypothetical protein
MESLGNAAALLGGWEVSRWLGAPPTPQLFRVAEGLQNTYEGSNFARTVDAAV